MLQVRFLVEVAKQNLEAFIISTTNYTKTAHFRLCSVLDSLQCILMRDRR